MAILSLVGKNMRNMVGVSSKMFTTLALNEINIEMISQGASEINISCVIEEAYASKALIAVHDNLVIGDDLRSLDPPTVIQLTPREEF
jgi:aspartate kinase